MTGLIFLTGVSQHTAQGINLVVFMPDAISALWVHIRKGRINFKMAAYLSVAEKYYTRRKRHE